jgi:hypothetical protein
VTTRTRRRIFVALIVVALTVPAETVLLKALSSSNDTQAAETWVAGLSQSELIEAGMQVRGFSYAYRREIMRQASPEQRVKFWSRHITDYVEARPELDREEREALAVALSVLSPEALSSPSKEKQESMRLAAENVERVLGRDQAEYLLVSLGPRETRFLSSLDPLTLRLASFVRSNFIADARAEYTCDCLPEWGCGGYYQSCSATATCDVDDYWPRCGWWWNENCTNLCTEGS